jgi:hypothetical protein
VGLWGSFCGFALGSFLYSSFSLFPFSIKFLITYQKKESDSIRLQVHLALLILQTKSMILNQITENVYFGSAFVKNCDLKT